VVAKLERGNMRVLVCGGRYFQNVVRLWRVLDAFHAKHTVEVADED
jgi:hypothetical protein